VRQRDLETVDRRPAPGVLRGRRSWLPELSREVLEAYRDRPADRPRELAAVIGSRPL